MNNDWQKELDLLFNDAQEATKKPQNGQVIKNTNTYTNEEYKPIETVYKSIRFRSRLEARWAVFFDACGVEWEYEDEGYEKEDGTFRYLPDFMIYGDKLKGRCENKLYIEVKGVMSEYDSKKIIEFAKHNKILIVGNIPKFDYYNDIHNWFSKKWFLTKENKCPFYSFEFIDGDCFGGFPAIVKEGWMEILDLENDSNYVDKEKTESAYRRALQARFEHGESPNCEVIV